MTTLLDKEEAILRTNYCKFLNLTKTDYIVKLDELEYTVEVLDREVYMCTLLRELYPGFRSRFRFINFIDKLGSIHEYVNKLDLYTTRLITILCVLPLYVLCTLPCLPLRAYLRAFYTPKLSEEDISDIFTTFSFLWTCLLLLCMCVYSSFIH